MKRVNSRKLKEEKLNVTSAKLDFLQSASGLILAVFIMGHILFEGSILISNEMMYKVTLMFEGYYFFGDRYPWIVSILAFIVFFVFILHALIAMRKFPADYRQYRTIKEHALRFKHEDTSLWLIQVITGFMMFFLGSVHLYMMMSQPENIGPYASSYRVVGEFMFPLYFLLLFSVVLHAFIGLYRLALKWGFMEGKSTKISRARFKSMMRAFIFVYLLVGLSSLIKYTNIGLSHDYTNCTKYQSKTIEAEKK